MPEDSCHCGKPLHYGYDGDPTHPLRDSARNRIAVWLANTALRLADSGYRARIQGAIIYGYKAAARDDREGNEPPE